MNLRMSLPPANSTEPSLRSLLRSRRSTTTLLEITIPQMPHCLHTRPRRRASGRARSCTWTRKSLYTRRNSLSTLLTKLVEPLVLCPKAGAHQRYTALGAGLRQALGGVCGEKSLQARAEPRHHSRAHLLCICPFLLATCTHSGPQVADTSLRSLRRDRGNFFMFVWAQNPTVEEFDDHRLVLVAARAFLQGAQESELTSEEYERAKLWRRTWFSSKAVRLEIIESLQSQVNGATKRKRTSRTRTGAAAPMTSLDHGPK